MLDPRELLDKHLLRLGRELRELRRRQFIRVTLDEPLQRGWRRFHVMSEKAERRVDREVLRTVLLRIGNVCFRNVPDFRKKRGKGRRRRYVEIEQPLHEICQGWWQTYAWPEEWKSYFRLKQRRRDGRVYETFVFDSPYLFELKIEPNMVTELYVPDAAVQQRISEIERWLIHHNARPRLKWLCDEGWHWRFDLRNHLLTRVVKRELRQAMQNPWEVDPAASVRFGRISLLAQQINFPRRSPIEEALRSERSQCGCNSCRRDFTIPAPVAQCRGSGLKLRPVPVQIRPGALFGT
jgi:hypothetical protein